MNQPQDGWIGRSCFHSRPLTVLEEVDIPQRPRFFASPLAQSQWHFGRQLHVWSDPLLERGLGPNRGLHRRPARHSNGTALAWDVFGHQHQRCENWARHESVMCHRGQWWGLLGHTFLFCIAANHWCLAHLRMFGPRNPTDGLNLNQHYNSIAYAKSGEVLIASSQNSPYVSLYVPWSKGSRWKHRGVKTP